MTTTATHLAVSLVLGLAASSVAAETPPELPRLGLQHAEASVIGVSSGGYMATQLAVAWPSRFEGLGVLAAGPWACAQGSLGTALAQCMSTRRGLPDLEDLTARYRDYLARDLVGTPESLASLRVFVWHGREDETVVPSLGAALVEQFTDWLADPEAQLRHLETEGAGHGWPVDASFEALADCAAGEGSHLLGCDLDIAGEALTWLHEGLAPPAASSSPAGTLTSFDQTAFDAKGLADRGYLFVPEACQAGGCTLTMALHGCNMASETLGETFVRYNGLNAWAEANRRVVLYPQAASSLANPQGCWDWWGYTESTWQLDPLHDSRQGTQITALMAMMDRLQAPPAKD